MLGSLLALLAETDALRKQLKLVEHIQLRPIKWGSKQDFFSRAESPVESSQESRLMDVAVTMQARFWCLRRDCQAEEKGSWKSKEESWAETSKAHFSLERGTDTPSVCASHPSTQGISQSVRPARARIPGLPCPPPANLGLQPLLQIQVWRTSAALGNPTLHQRAGGDPPYQQR